MGKRRYKRKYNVEELKRYVKEGESNSVIAEIMGVSPSTVINWVRENGLTGIRRHGGNNRKKCGNQTEMLSDEPEFGAIKRNRTMAIEVIVNKWNRRGDEQEGEWKDENGI